MDTNQVAGYPDLQRTYASNMIICITHRPQRCETIVDAAAAWSELPGEQMQPDPKQPGLFLVTLPLGTVEFVFNNGNNDWDSPMSGNNYAIDEPGEFLVQSGTISKLS